MIVPMNRKYELLLVLATTGDYESEKKREDVVKKLIGDATLDSVTLLGKKLLAYPIKKQTDAVYLLAIVSGEALTVGSIQKKATQMPDLLRFLLIRKE